MDGRWSLIVVLLGGCTFDAFGSGASGESDGQSGGTMSTGPTSGSAASTSLTSAGVTSAGSEATSADATASASTTDDATSTGAGTSSSASTTDAGSTGSGATGASTGTQGCSGRDDCALGVCLGEVCTTYGQVCGGDDECDQAAGESCCDDGTYCGSGSCLVLCPGGDGSVCPAGTGCSHDICFPLCTIAADCDDYPDLSCFHDAYCEN